MTNEEVGKVIKERRNACGITLDEIADACGVNRSTVCRWELGMNSNLKRNHIEILSRMLYLPVEKILGWETDEQEVSSEVVKAKRKLIKTLDTINNIDDLNNIDKYINLMIIKK